MEKNNMKNNLARIIACFIMLLFAVCSIVNVFFCADYNFYEFIDKTAVIGTQPISEIVAANEGDDNTACFESSFLNNNNSLYQNYNEKYIPAVHDCRCFKRIYSASLFLFYLLFHFLYFIA